MRGRVGKSRLCGSKCVSCSRCGLRFGRPAGGKRETKRSVWDLVTAKVGPTLFVVWYCLGTGSGVRTLKEFAPNSLRPV